MSKDKDAPGTFNGLAQEFQLGPAHDKNFIFPRELEVPP